MKARLVHFPLTLLTAALLPFAAKGAGIPPASADVHRFTIGNLEAFALKDGDITVPNNGQTVGVGQPPETVSALLTAAGLPADKVEFSIQPLLVRADGRIVLFDTGAGTADFAVAGRLFASLRAAGIAPAEVTDIFISHAHPDHVGGLVNAQGALAFPNATIHLSAAEWAWMKADRAQAALVRAITSKVAPFQPGEKITPHITTVSIHGHTPGHAGAEIQSADERLLYIGDAAHHSIISVQRSEWTINFDEDADAARAARRATLQRAADENLRIFAYHFPFPGLGHVREKDGSFVWIAEP